MKVNIKNIKKIISEEIAREFKTNKKLAEMGIQSQGMSGGANPVGTLSDIYNEVKDEAISRSGDEVAQMMHDQGEETGWQPDTDDFVEMASRFRQEMGRMPTAEEWTRAIGKPPSMQLQRKLQQLLARH